MPATEQVQVDVLVIGGGLAALQATVSALREGASVAVAVKGKLGRSGSSAMTTGGYAAVLPEEGTGDDRAIHFEDTLRGGAYMGDPRLIRILCEEAAEGVRELERIGSQFLKEEERYHLSPSGDHSFPRVLVPVNHMGTDFTVPMARYAQSLGVQALEFTMALDLLLAGDRVSGAVCLDLKEGRLVTVLAGATVLCTGGCGRLFPVTSNPSDVTGDGFALAARAGAALRDMEFIQFYPWRCIDPFDRSRVAIQPSTFVLGGRLYNSRDERFMWQYDPERCEATTRDVAARGIFDQIRKGLGVRGGVRLDLSSLSEEEFQKSNPKVWRGLQVKKIDYRTYDFIVAPEAHYFMGGVRIDEYGRSTVEGLFAAGEVAGGIQGANRLNSNALPETVIFGDRAGRVAAELARATPAPLVPGEQIARWERRITGGGHEPATTFAPMLEELQQRMALSLGIVRNQAAMEEGVEFVRTLRDRLEQSRPSDPAALREWIELGYLCDVGELCLTGALLRTESRGAHYREDAPETDDRTWRRTIVLRKSESGTVTHRFVPLESAPQLGGSGVSASNP